MTRPLRQDVDYWTDGATRRSTQTGMEHSPTSATGTGWERIPWHATQRVAWEALKKADERSR
jgi:hypothetical protein